MKPINKVSLYLTQNAESLADEIVAEIVGRFNFKVPQGEIDHAITIYKEFFKFSGAITSVEEHAIPEGLLEWSKENGEREAANGGNISDILIRYPDTRVVFTERISKIRLECGLSLEEIIFIIKKVNYMFDISINETVFAFERLTQKILKETQSEINELSAAIVPIQDRKAILPLIGSIDYDRAKLIIEKVVPKVAALEIEYLIIDFSGTVNIDTNVARYIFDIRNILQLTGVKTIATGVRPDLAKNVISEGIDLNSLNVYSTVQQAIMSIS